MRALDSAFFNALRALAPPGLETVTNVGTVNAGAAINNADAFLTAISQAEEQGATLTAFVARPTDALALGKLKQTKDSNVPLLGIAPTLPTRPTVLGVPLHVCSTVKPGTIWGLPKDRVMAVMRRDAKLDVSRDAEFTSDQVAVKATMRAAGAFPHPAANPEDHRGRGPICPTWCRRHQYLTRPGGAVGTLARKTAGAIVHADRLVLHESAPVRASNGCRAGADGAVS